jgi:hypothetical protein
LITHKDIWIKIGDSHFHGDTQQVIDQVVKGMQEDGLYSKPRPGYEPVVNSQTIFKMMDKARIIMRANKKLEMSR